MYTERLLNYATIENPSWKQIIEKILSSIPTMPVKTNKFIGNRWWNKDCYNVRKSARSALHAARNDTLLWPKYYDARKEYKRIVFDSKKKLQDQHLMELRNIANMKDAWKYINQHKQHKLQPTPNKDQLAQHFYTLLNGKPYEATYEIKELRSQEQITADEFNTHINNLKKKKASGPDEIMAEAYIYADAQTKNDSKQIMERCLNGEDLPPSWRESLIHPLSRPMATSQNT